MTKDRPRILNFFPHYPEYDLSKNLPFSSCYRLVNSVSYSFEGHRKPNVILNNVKPFKCALCGDTENETTFVEEAHTVLAALGNRYHTTKEECDPCNFKYGIEDDQHLALWLNP